MTLHFDMYIVEYQYKAEVQNEFMMKFIFLTKITVKRY